MLLSNFSPHQTFCKSICTTCLFWLASFCQSWGDGLFLWSECQFIMLKFTEISTVTFFANMALPLISSFSGLSTGKLSQVWKSFLCNTWLHALRLSALFILHDYIHLVLTVGRELTCSPLSDRLQICRSMANSQMAKEQVVEENSQRAACIETSLLLLSQAWTCFISKLLQSVFFFLTVLTTEPCCPFVYLSISLTVQSCTPEHFFISAIKL